MGAHRIAACVLLVATACTTQRAVPTTTPTSAPGPTPLVAALPDGPCEGIGAAPPEPQVTFAVDGNVYSAAADGTDVRCLVETDDGGRLEWGADADRLVVGAEVFHPEGRNAVGVVNAHWSRPTGTALVYVSDGRLWKRPSAGGEPFEISFLERHDEVVYHPAGTHIAVVGEDAEGRYGIFVAMNRGEEPEFFADFDTAERIFGLAYREATGDLVFAADHGEEYHIHTLAQISGGGLSTDHVVPEPVGAIVPDQQDTATFAFRRGSCEGRTRTIVRKDETLSPVRELSAASTEPIGWVGAGALVVLARDSGCSGPGDLHVWTESTSALLVRGVDSAAVRAVTPGRPPEPPRPEEEVFA